MLIDHERFFFYSDDSEGSDDEGQAEVSDAKPRSGVRGWLQEKFLRFKSAWKHADEGALHWMRRAWDWLHKLTRPDEPMLARLRPARRIDLHHPAAYGGDEVRIVWREYLRRQWWRHLLWMSVHGVIAPVSAILAVLPGPNVIGYWFAYRALHHSLVVWGIRRILNEKIPIELHSLAELDVPIDHDDQGEARHAALNGSAARLGDHVTWWRRWGRWMIPGRSRLPVRSASSQPRLPANRPETREDE